MNKLYNEQQTVLSKQNDKEAKYIYTGMRAVPVQKS
jgi:hypothetical protein